MLNLDNAIIVSRHPAAVEWLSNLLGGELSPQHDHLVMPNGATVPIRASATAADVRGKTAVGNLPLFLAAEAASMYTIEFAGAPPRGREYGAADMAAAGAKLEHYVVLTVPPMQ